MGTIPADVIEKMKRHFQRLDIDGDGHVTSQELKQVLQSIGVNPDPNLLQVMMSEVDDNHNGMLEFEDFVQLVMKHCPNDGSLWSALLQATAAETSNQKLSDEQISVLRTYFDKLDIDKNGHLSVAEIHLLFNKHLNIPMSIAQVTSLVNQADTSQNGQVEFDEFVTLITSMNEVDSGMWGQLIRGVAARPNILDDDQLAFLRSHFDQLDLDGNGHVTISELYLMFKALKVPITQELLDKLIQEADANANGEIEFDEFIALSLNLQDTDSNAWASFLRATRPTQLERVRTNVESMFGITTEAQKRNIKYYQSKSFFQRTDQPQMQSKTWTESLSGLVGWDQGKSSKKDVEMQSKSDSENDVTKDPEVIKQIKEQEKRNYRPWFLALVTLTQVAMMAVELIPTGFEDPAINIFFGPTKLIQLKYGAKYAPCMREDPGAVERTPYVSCPDGYTGTPEQVINGTCLMTYYEYLSYNCQMGGFTVPNQYWRFITPLFIHVGLLQLAFTVVFQIWKGFPIERDIGSIRMAVIYLISGIFGIAWSANMSPNQISCAPTGPLFAILGLLYLDLFQNWPLLLNPWRWFIILTIIVVVLLGVGLLPFIDNYSHMGSFGMGILTGLIFVPSISFGKWDGRRKKIAMGLSIPVVILLYFGAFYAFFDGKDTNTCKYCSVLDCVPPESSFCKEGSLNFI